MAFIKFVRGGYTTSPPLRDITGTMAAVEDGEDIFAATGTSEGAPVTGTMAAQETGSDTFSATGVTQEVNFANGDTFEQGGVSPTYLHTIDQGGVSPTYTDTFEQGLAA